MIYPNGRKKVIQNNFDTLQETEHYLDGLPFIASDIIFEIVAYYTQSAKAGKNTLNYYYEQKNNPQ
jgi:hypothetical protein